jgi:hypothetical protein
MGAMGSRRRRLGGRRAARAGAEAMRIIAFILGVALMCAGLAHGQTVWAISNRTIPSQMAVGGQFNGWTTALGPGWTFGSASEAVGYPGSGGYLIGAENLVQNMEPGNTARKIANNAVFKCRWDDDARPCSSPSNVDSIAYWVSAQGETGFGSALKLDRYSIADFPGHRATVIDLSDMDPKRNGDVVLFKLPGGREVTIAQFIRVLDK